MRGRYASRNTRLDYSRAMKLQQELAKRCIVKDAFERIRFVAGLDLSYRGDIGHGVAVLLEYPTLKPLAVSIVEAYVDIPYVPGFLAFREAPLAYAALTRLETRGYQVDLLVIDGHGRAHPRKAGIATHIGVALDKPSIGVAKRRLAGQDCRFHGLDALCLGDEPVAVVLTHRRRKLYISVGHRVSLETAYTLVRRMLLPYAALPAPTHYADTASKQSRGIRECLEGEIEACEDKLLEALVKLYERHAGQRTLI